MVGRPSTLRRSMGLRTVTSTSTGLAFAAIEYLAVASLLVYVAGDLAWVSIAVAGLLALLAWGYFSELSGLYPTAAGIRLFMAKSMDDRAALVITFSYLATIVLVLAADAFIVGSALTHVTGLPAWATGVVVAALLGLATTANLRGITVAGRVQDVTTYLVMAVTVLLGALSLTKTRTAASLAAAHTHHHGVGSFVVAIGLGVLLYSSFEWVTMNAEEVREQRLIPRGMLIALGLLFVACALVSTGMGRLLSSGELASAYPQLFFGKRVLGEAGYVLMCAITLVTAVNTFNGGFITASRFVYATAREGSLPRSFAKLNDRAVPWVPVVALATSSLLASLAVVLAGSFQVLLSTGAALECGVYAVAALCVLRLRKRQAAAEREFRVRAARLACGVGLVLFGVLGLLSSVSVDNETNPLPLAIIAVIAGIASVYVLRYLPRMRAAEEARRAAAPRRRRPPIAVTDPAAITPASAASAATATTPGLPTPVMDAGFLDGTAPTGPDDRP